MCLRQKEGWHAPLWPGLGQAQYTREDRESRLRQLLSIVDRLRGARFFTAIDVTSGFFQIEITEQDKEKKAFRDANGRLWE